MVIEMAALTSAELKLIQESRGSEGASVRLAGRARVGLILVCVGVAFQAVIGVWDWLAEESTLKQLGKELGFGVS